MLVLKVVDVEIFKIIKSVLINITLLVGLLAITLTKVFHWLGYERVK